MSCWLEGWQLAINQGLWLMRLVPALPPTLGPRPRTPQGLAAGGVSELPDADRAPAALPASAFPALAFHLCLRSRLCNQEGNLLFCWKKTC